MMFIEAKYNIGQTVFLKTDKDQAPRIVTKIIVSPTGVFYNLSCGTSDSAHYDIEISETVDVLIKQ